MRICFHGSSPALALGGLIAALTACHTDEELKVLLVPKLANKLTACDEPFSVWGKRLWETGARFDSVM